MHLQIIKRLKAHTFVQPYGSRVRLGNFKPETFDFVAEIRFDILKIRSSESLASELGKYEKFFQPKNRTAHLV